MKTLDFIGLNPTSVANTTKELQVLLAGMQVFYTNLRGFHWNVKSDQFFTLHAKFEELYNVVNEQIDEVAERLLALGDVPKNMFSEYLKTSTVKEVGSTFCPIECTKGVLDGYKTIIAQERKVQEVAGKGGDEVTDDMMTGYLTGQEKTVWMLVAYLSSKPE